MATHLKVNKEGLAEDLRLLSLVDILEPLSREELAGLNWKHLETHVEPGETFYTPMDLCETLFILKQGRVRLYKMTPDKREFTLAVLQSGTVFGEMTLTAQRLRNAYAEAVEPSDIATMCRADVERLILDKPKVGLQLVHLLGERLYNYEIRMEYLGLREVPARLANLLLLIVESEGVRTRTHYKIPTRYTHQQLGTMIGANREAVTRALNRLREIGALEVRRRYIYVKEMEALQRATEESPE
jgi:CRP/FNR family cyclic AMP-dependent transcriptional regulator